MVGYRMYAMLDMKKNGKEIANDDTFTDAAKAAVETTSEYVSGG